MKHYMERYKELIVELERTADGHNKSADDFAELIKGFEPKNDEQRKLKEQLKTFASNLKDYSDKIYYLFEQAQVFDGYEDENKELSTTIETLKDILSPLLSWKEKIYIRVRYGIDIN